MISPVGGCGCALAERRLTPKPGQGTFVPPTGHATNLLYLRRDERMHEVSEISGIRRNRIVINGHKTDTVTLFHSLQSFAHCVCQGDFIC